MKTAKEIFEYYIGGIKNAKNDFDKQQIADEWYVVYPSLSAEIKAEMKPFFDNSKLEYKKMADDLDKRIAMAGLFSYENALTV